MPRILVVDAEPFQRLLIRETLAEDSTFGFLEAPNSIQAIDLARKHQPDLIILETRLPGPDGFYVCQQLKADASLQAIPVILITTSLLDADVTKAHTMGANTLLCKPFETEQLQAAVRDALRCGALSSSS